MHSSLSLVLVFVTASASPTNDCVLSTSDALTDGLDTAFSIWAASKRCPPQKHSPVLCEQDIANSISDLTALGSAIAGIVSSCSDVTDDHCSMAANDLVSASAGLAAAGGAIAEKCTDIKSHDVLGLQTDLAKCTGGALGGLGSMLHAADSLHEMKSGCKHASYVDASSAAETECTVSTLGIVNVLASFGAYISGAFGDCAAVAKSPVDTDAAGCASAVLAAIAQLTGASVAGLHMKEACSASASRLYLDTQGQATSYSSMFTALAAALPLAAVLGFLAGSRLAKVRGHAVSQRGHGDGIESQPLTTSD